MADPPVFFISADSDPTNHSVSGGETADVIVTGGGDDTLIGAGGDDSLNGGVGSDRIFGGDGADRIVFDAADASISGGDGFDVADASGSVGGLGLLSGDDVVSGIEHLIGSDHADFISSAVADTIDAGDGADRFYIYGDDGPVDARGEGGADIFYLYDDIDAVTLSGGDGFDRAYNFGSSVLDLSGAAIEYGRAGIGNDTLIADDGGSTLDGHNANDVLFGGAGADRIIINGYEAAIDGGEGFDILDGSTAVEALGLTGARAVGDRACHRV